MMCVKNRMATNTTGERDGRPGFHCSKEAL